MTPASCMNNLHNRGNYFRFRESESLLSPKEFHLIGKKILKSVFQSFFNVKGQRGAEF